MEKSETIVELAKALSQFQGAVQTVEKEAENPFYKHKYADLANIWNTIRAPLAKAGLSVTQIPTADERYAGNLILTTMLLHQSGEYISGSYDVIVTKPNDPQAVGSAITYARRYALCAILGIAAADDDDDAEAATDHKVDKKPATKQTSKPHPQDAQQDGHFCHEHNVPYTLMTKGNAKWYSHKYDGGWCNEDKPKPAPEDDPTKEVPVTDLVKPKPKIIIDMDKLKENLTALKWKDVLQYIKTTYSVEGRSVSECVPHMTEEQQMAFVEEVNERVSML